MSNPNILEESRKYWKKVKSGEIFRSKKYEKNLVSYRSKFTRALYSPFYMVDGTVEEVILVDRVKRVFGVVKSNENEYVGPLNA